MEWMSWEGGVDLVGATRDGLEMPNVILHVARVVHTPVGSAPAGMVLYQPAPEAEPKVMGFVCPDPKVGAYFGPRIFAGTPFAEAPTLAATIQIESTDDEARSRIEVEGTVFEVALRDLGALSSREREPGPMPFAQRVLEAAAGEATVKVDGEDLKVQLPKIGLSGGAPAVWAPAGFYSRS